MTTTETALMVTEELMAAKGKVRKAVRAGVTTGRLRNMLRTRFDGVLRYGGHGKGRNKCCGLELLSQVFGLEWTDSPEWLHTMDLRVLNDVKGISNEHRTKHLLPVLAACAGSMLWPKAQLNAILCKVIHGLTTLMEVNIKWRSKSKVAVMGRDIVEYLYYPVGRIEVGVSSVLNLFDRYAPDDYTVLEACQLYVNIGTSRTTTKEERYVQVCDLWVRSV